jgi:hypothetical protein
MIIKKKIKKSASLKKNKNKFENFYYFIDKKNKIAIDGDTYK